MKGLLIKDFLLLKRSAKLIFLFLAVFCVTGLWSGNASFFATMAAVLCATTVNSTLSYDNLAKWEQFALSAPVSRRQLVGEKYVLALIMTGIAGVMCLLVIVLNAFLPDRQPPLELAVMCFSVLGGSFLMVSLIIPLTIRFGSENGRIVLAASMAAMFGVVFAIVHLFYGEGEATLPTLPPYAVWGVPVLLILLFYVSYRISCAIVEKKEY